MTNKNKNLFNLDELSDYKVSEIIEMCGVGM